MLLSLGWFSCMEEARQRFLLSYHLPQLNGSSCSASRSSPRLYHHQECAAPISPGLCVKINREQGQYHYTYIVAPERTRNFAAYIVGFLNIIAWWANAASGTIYVAISAFGIASFWHEDLAVKQWQVYLLYLLVIAVTRKKIIPLSRRLCQKHLADVFPVIPIFTVPQKHLDYMTKASLYLSVFGLVMIIIIALAMGRDHYQPKHLVEYEGTSGWSPGPAWMLSIATGQYCFFGTGACTHIAEEMPQPSRKLPRVM